MNSRYGMARSAIGSACRVCGTETSNILLDLGNQPVCNRFLSGAEEPEFTHPFVVGQCTGCGIVHIMDPFPLPDVVPVHAWITYNEPEEHLDTLVDVVSRLPGLTQESPICGVSFKDDSTLRRLERAGFRNVWRIKEADDLGIGHSGAGVESVQDRINPATAGRIAGKRGVADVVIVRHILEHAYRTREFLAGLRELVSPRGYIVLEVPDCSIALEGNDYTTLWEEHLVYFTPETFTACFRTNGFYPVYTACYPYPFENSLVAIVKTAPDEETAPMPAGLLESERRRAERFAGAFPVRREKIRDYLREFKYHSGKIAVFGAGHLTCAYINFLALRDVIEFVVDDNPNKTGRFMPGSRLPIRPASSLVRDDIRLCLLGLSPRAERSVMERHRGFTEKGGTFVSIFPGSDIALKL